MDEDWLNEDTHTAPGGASDPIVEQNWERITTRYSDVGYREGISEGKLSSLQEGFDQSFATSVPWVRRLGNIRGSAAGLLAFAVGSRDDLVQEIRAFIAVLGKVKASDVLPVDQEALEHAKEHMAGDHEEPIRAEQEMEDLISTMDGLTQTASSSQREGELLSSLEDRLRSLQAAAGLA
jgi:hypothetical protein